LEIDLPTELEVAMLQLQQFLTARQFAWFHPHDRRILARRGEPDQMDLVWDAFMVEDELKLKIRTPFGDPSQVDTLVEEFSAVLQIASH
jgi:hypothetical protein